MDKTPFTIFGASHWLAMLLSLAAAWGLVRFFRGAASDQAKWRVRVVLAVGLFASVLADPIITYLR